MITIQTSIVILDLIDILQQTSFYHPPLSTNQAVEGWGNFSGCLSKLYQGNSECDVSLKVVPPTEMSSFVQLRFHV